MHAQSQRKTESELVVASVIGVTQCRIKKSTKRQRNFYKMKRSENGSGQCYKTVSAFNPIVRIPGRNVLVSDHRKTQRIPKKNVRKTFVFSKLASMNWRCLSLKADTRNILSLAFVFLARG